MRGFEIKFNVYADTQEEADYASSQIKQFVTDLAQQGIAVTATKLAGAVIRWKDNHFVTNYFK